MISLPDMVGPIAKGVWPPPGELGGVGFFAAVVLALSGFAIWLGMRRPPVLITAGMLAGAWVMRFYLASHEYRDQLVRYWPRTTTFSLYCMLILSVFAVKLIAERVQEFVRQHEALTQAARTDAQAAADTATEVDALDTLDTPTPSRKTARRPAPIRTGLVGLGFALTLFGGISASAATDKIMPKNDGSEGQLAWQAHHDAPANLVPGETKVNGK